MTKKELLKWFRENDDVRLPNYVEAEGETDHVLDITGKEQFKPYVWSLFRTSDGWEYAETDLIFGRVEKRGISLTEEEAANDTLERFMGYLKEELEPFHWAARWIQKQFGHNSMNAYAIAEELQRGDDIFLEFLACARKGSFLDYDGIEEQGWTANGLGETFGTTILGAYMYLVKLRESPKETLLDLKGRENPGKVPKGCICNGIGNQFKIKQNYMISAKGGKLSFPYYGILQLMNVPGTEECDFQIDFCPVCGRETENPEILARRKRKNEGNCVYCMGGQPIRTEPYSPNDAWMQIDRKKREMRIRTEGGETHTYPISFCPACGKPLSPEESD